MIKNVLEQKLFHLSGLSVTPYIQRNIMYVIVPMHTHDIII